MDLSKCGNSWQTSLANRLNKNTTCPYCTSKNTKFKIGFNDLTITNPELLKEWDYEKNTISPNEITSKYRKSVYWKCLNGFNHSYLQPVYVHKKGSKCPYCSGHRVLTGFNDIETKYFNISKEWDYNSSINDGLTPKLISAGSHKIIQWVCSDCGSKYQRKVYDRIINGRGCPICRAKKEK